MGTEYQAYNQSADWRVISRIFFFAVVWRTGRRWWRPGRLG
jgi:hypothetical protein